LHHIRCVTFRQINFLSTFRTVSCKSQPCASCTNPRILFLSYHP